MLLYTDLVVLVTPRFLFSRVRTESYNDGKPELGVFPCKHTLDAYMQDDNDDQILVIHV